LKKKKKKKELGEGMLVWCMMEVLVLSGEPVA
jgi:hypothetical protein